MNPLAGLVLCGGDSSRMGEDKCFLRYHLEPQWVHVSCLLRSVCSNVTVSCRMGQLSRLSEVIPSVSHAPTLLADLPEYAGHGPISGLLSGFHRYPDHSILLVGCDYPLLTLSELQLLIGSRRKDVDAVCFARDIERLDEPLVAIYENSALPIVKDCFRSGAHSLREVLQGLRTLRLKIPAHDPLVSVDTPAEFHQMNLRMKSAR